MPADLAAIQQKAGGSQVLQPYNHLLGAAFKLRLLCLVPVWDMLQPHLCLAVSLVDPYLWIWPQTCLTTTALSGDLDWWPVLLVLFWVLWGSSLVSKLPPSAHGSFSPSKLCLPLLLPNTQPHSTAQVTRLYCFWFQCWAGQTLFRYHYMTLLHWASKPVLFRACYRDLQCNGRAVWKGPY